MIIAMMALPLSGALIWGGVQTVNVARASYDEVQQDIRDRVLGVGDYAPIEVEYDLLNGWNLVAFPIEMNETSALVLMVDIAQAGGYVTTVSYWDGDRWVEVSQRQGVVFGHDFELVPGRAYFVRNHIPVTWRVTGTPVPSKQLAIELNRGWNAIGLGTIQVPVERVLDEMNQDQERASEINRWRSGLWDPYVKRIYSRDDIQTYGDNYMTEWHQGYMVKVNKDMRFRVGGVGEE